MLCRLPRKSMTHILTSLNMFCRDLVLDEKPSKFNVGQNLWEDLEHKRKVELRNLIKETCSTSLSHENIKLKQGGNILPNMWKGNWGNVYLCCDMCHKTPIPHWPTPRQECWNPRQECWNPRAGNWCSVKSRCQLESTGPVCPVSQRGMLSGSATSLLGTISKQKNCKHRKSVYCSYFLMPPNWKQLKYLAI